MDLLEEFEKKKALSTSLAVWNTSYFFPQFCSVTEVAIIIRLFSQIWL
jgi:hypothetical protein